MREPGDWVQARRMAWATSSGSSISLAATPSTVRPVPMANSVRQPSNAYAVVPGRGSVAPIVMALGNTSPNDASVPDQEASVDVVLGLLTTWQKALHVAP